MSQGAALAKSLLAAFLALGTLWHLFGKGLSNWMTPDTSRPEWRRR